MKLLLSINQVFRTWGVTRGNCCRHLWAIDQITIALPIIHVGLFPFFWVMNGPPIFAALIQGGLSILFDM
jgi:hypothetical protein